MDPPFQAEMPSAKACEAPGGDYNLLPYPSLPFAYTQPSNLAALACLFGLRAPAAETARVLELGCASGGNIIPLAARFPCARFVGIDLAQRQVDEGCRRIAQLGLTNVELRQDDLAAARLSGETFDYVICHGVFSWVPKATQDSILRLCAQVLAPEGLATVSYNVLPGWHLRSVIRDICLHHVGSTGSPRDRVAGARRLLEEIAESVGETDPYGLLLRREAKRISRLPAAYVLGEFLAPDNTPLHFHEFVGRIEQFGLGYLCEGDLASSVSEGLFPKTEKALQRVSGSSRHALEQYKDFFTGRPFRRSVIARSQHLANAANCVSPGKLRCLHVASPLKFDASASSLEVPVFRDARDRTVVSRDAEVCRVLSSLAEAFPQTVHVAQFAGVDTGDSAIPQRICQALFSLLAAGQATVSTMPLSVGSAAAQRPNVWPLAKLEAAAGQPWITNLQHEAVSLPPVAAALLPHLDGTNNRQALAALLTNATQRGAAASREAIGPRSAMPVAPDAEVQVDKAIDHLARNALLLPE